MSARPDSAPEPDPPAESATSAPTGTSPATRHAWWTQFRPEPGEVRELALLVIALAVAGVLGGIVWPLVAPRDRYEVVDGGVRAVQAESEALVGADLVFAAVVTVIGVVAAVVLWTRPRWRGPLTSVALVVGLLLCGVITWQIGMLFRPPPTSEELATLGAIVTGPLRLRSWVALLLPPAVSLLVYVVCVVLAARDDLGHVPPHASGPAASTAPNGPSGPTDPAGPTGPTQPPSAATCTDSADRSPEPDSTSSSTGRRPAH